MSRKHPPTHHEAADPRELPGADDLDDLPALDPDDGDAGVSAAAHAPARLVVIEDHPLVREATVAYLTRDPDLEVVGAAETGAQGIELCRRLRPAAVVLDLGLPDMSGLDVARELRLLPRPPAILIQSGTIDRVFVEAALRIGASGYIDKGTSPDELIDAVRAVLRGETIVLRGAALRAQFDGGDGG